MTITGFVVCALLTLDILTVKSDLKDVGAREREGAQECRL